MIGPFFHATPALKARHVGARVELDEGTLNWQRTLSSSAVGMRHTDVQVAHYFYGHSHCQETGHGSFEQEM